MLSSLRPMLICAGLGLGLAFAAGAGHATPAAHKLSLRSAAAIIQDQETGEILYGKNASAVAPIASITKLMTAMVVLDAGLDLNETITISAEDMDALRNTRSRLKPGVSLSRDELLRVALMASENRAAAALGRTYPGGIEAFTRAMNLRRKCWA
jgi:D-alanyl-D-alanine endopeptidase (penicillin-binding protein 7)